MYQGGGGVHCVLNIIVDFGGSKMTKGYEDEI
jgi:hypothetical protein